MSAKRLLGGYIPNEKIGLILLVNQSTEIPVQDGIKLWIITSPLHLHSIHFPPQSQASSLKEYQNGKIKISNFKYQYAAGGLVSDVGDLSSFIRHLFVIKDLLPTRQYMELITFVETSESYYAFTGEKAPQFGLGVFKWNILPYGDVLMYPGVLKEGFTSAYTVIGKNVIISQSNTYNHNDFTILWLHRDFTTGLIEKLITAQ